VYNFRREMDCEQFRMACKYGKQYIESHIIRRMLPALHRSAMAGRYPGGYVPWGYVVDYGQQSVTHKHLIHYEPHAKLVVNAVFRRFAGMAQPTVSELERSWHREGLVWPFFSSEVDPRRIRWVDAHCTRDEACGGYPLHFRQAQKILTDVAYLGWRVRSGEVAREEDGHPKQCHEPLIEADLFWWCYDRITGERPAWSEGWAPARSPSVATTYRPRLLRSRAQPGDVRFLAPGKVRCVVHNKFVVATTGRRDHIELQCGGGTPTETEPCARVFAEPVELALSRSFVEQLQLDARDEAALAKIAQRQQTQRQGGAVEELQRQLAEQCKRYERVKRLSLEAPDLAQDVVDDFRKAKQAMQELERSIEEARAATPPTAQAWQLAHRAMAWADRIRATFLEWPREAQARVLTLALDDAALGWVSRYALGVWMRWHGGAESRQEIASRKGKMIAWTAAEDEALRQFYGSLTREALQKMMPGRTMAAIEQRASRLGLARPGNGGSVSVPPLVFPAPQVANTMARYGFPVGDLTSALDGIGA
jgi:hypothetical protein